MANSLPTVKHISKHATTWRHDAQMIYYFSFDNLEFPLCTHHTTSNLKRTIYKPSSCHLLIRGHHQQNLKTQETKFLSNTNPFHHNLCHLVAMAILYYVISTPGTSGKATFALEFYCQTPANRTNTLQITFNSACQMVQIESLSA